MSNQASWDRLERLVSRRRHLSGPEVDEIVDLYQRVSTHLSLIRSTSTDPDLVVRLSVLVARARSVVSGAYAPLWKDVARFWTVVFPLAAYRARWWWLWTTVAFLAFTVLVALWVGGSPEVQAALGSREEIRRLVDEDFASYYSDNPAASFAFEVWLNNVKVAVTCIGSAAALGLPIPYVLFANAWNTGIIAGFMSSSGKTGFMLGLLAPHGQLELSAVFLAAAVGMRLGWAVIAPGDRPRSQALGEQGRVVASVAVGMVLLLGVAGLIEAYVTPSSLPTAMRVGIGVLVELAFLGYVVHLGRRAARSGESGDTPDAPDVLPTS